MTCLLSGWYVMGYSLQSLQFLLLWGTLKGRANMSNVHFLQELQHCLRISWDIAGQELCHMLKNIFGMCQDCLEA